MMARCERTGKRLRREQVVGLLNLESSSYDGRRPRVAGADAKTLDDERRRIWRRTSLSGSPD